MAKVIDGHDVELETQTDEGGNNRKVLTIKKGTKTYQFSPNATDAEIKAQIANGFKGISAVEAEGAK